MSLGRREGAAGARRVFERVLLGLAALAGVSRMLRQKGLRTGTSAPATESTLIDDFLERVLGAADAERSTDVEDSRPEPAKRSEDPPAEPDPFPRIEGAPAGRGITDPERSAAARLQQLRQQSLVSTRSTAEKWAGTTAALITAVGLASIVQGAKQVRALGDDYEPYVAGGLLLAFALALAGTILAAIAAQGVSPTKMSKLTAAELLSYENSEANRAQRQLNASRVLVVVSIVFVTVAVGFFFYAPTDSETQGPKVLVFTDGGELICGELTAQDANGGFTVVDESGDEQTVDADEAASISSVGSCPEPFEARSR